MSVLENVMMGPCIVLGRPREEVEAKARSLLADASSLMVACGPALRRFDPS